MRIDIGTSVKTIEGDEVGRVERVIVDPDSKEVDGIVVHRGVILTRDIVVHISLVQDADPSEVRLRIGRDRLKDLPDFIETHYARPTPAQVTTYPYAPGSMLFPLTPSVYQPPEEVVRMPEGDVDIAAGTEVLAVDGTIGNVDEIRTDQYTNEMTTIVVRRGGRDVEIPLEFVSEVTDDHIQLTLTTEQVDALPEPTTDRYIVVEGKERGEEGEG